MKLPSSTPAAIRAAISANLQELKKTLSTDLDAQELLHEINLLVGDLYIAQQTQERVIAQQQLTIETLMTQRDEMTKMMMEERSGLRHEMWTEGRRFLARRLAARMGIDGDVLWSFLEDWAAGAVSQTEVGDLESLLKWVMEYGYMLEEKS